jgi:hypothetical protein
MPIDMNEYETLVSEFHNLMEQVPERFASVKLAPDKWSLKEIVGHLIDSASNNHQRFVRLQLDNVLIFPGYDAESWLSVQKHNEIDWHSLITLWSSYNEMLLHLVKNVNPGKLNNTWENENEIYSLEMLIHYYYRHMKWHEGHFNERSAEVRG